MPGNKAPGAGTIAPTLFSYVVVIDSMHLPVMGSKLRWKHKETSELVAFVSKEKVKVPPTCTAVGFKRTAAPAVFVTTGSVKLYV